MDVGDVALVGPLRDLRHLLQQGVRELPVLSADPLDGWPHVDVAESQSDQESDELLHKKPPFIIRIPKI